jgi:hypothetical protein
MAEIVYKRKEYKLALACIILAIFGLSLPSIICGHISILELRKKQNADALTIKRMAIGGLIFGYVGMLIWFYLGLLGAAIYFNWDLKPLFPYGLNLQL